MMAAINPTSGSPYTGTSGYTGVSQGAELQQEFLKLLIAQLRNQDPMSPMDNSQFVSQLAQFSTLEQMNNVAVAVKELTESMVILNSQSLLTQGAAMIGKEISGRINTGRMNETGNEITEEITGIVTSVKWSNGSLILMVGDTALTLEDITEIRDVGVGKNTEINTNSNQADTDANTNINTTTDTNIDPNTNTETEA